MIKKITATGKEIEKMLLSGEILRASNIENYVPVQGHVVHQSVVKYQNGNGSFDDSYLIFTNNGKEIDWYVLYPEGEPETIQIRDPFKSFLDACDWLSDISNEYSHGETGVRQAKCILTILELKDKWQTMFKIYYPEIKTKITRYYVDSQGNEVEIKNEEKKN